MTYRTHFRYSITLHAGRPRRIRGACWLLGRCARPRKTAALPGATGALPPLCGPIIAARTAGSLKCARRWWAIRATDRSYGSTKRKRPPRKAAVLPDPRVRAGPVIRNYSAGLRRSRRGRHRHRWCGGGVSRSADRPSRSGPRNRHCRRRSCGRRSGTRPGRGRRSAICTCLHAGSERWRIHRLAAWRHPSARSAARIWLPR